jgi:hypothetical protein
MDKTTNDKIVLQTAFPPLFVNGYITEQLERFGILDGNQGMNPIMPVLSTNIDDIYGERLSPPGEEPVVIFYDKLLRFRPSTFYRHKREQLIYTVHGPLDKVLATMRIVSAALDREDSAAQDVNLWAATNPVLDDYGVALPTNVFFHNFKTYQVDESRDLLELSSVRAIYTNKIIIEYDYHTTDTASTFYQ